MWEWIIPILIKLLVDFLISLFMKYGPTNPTISEEQFVDLVGWRIWLGPKRKDYARALYKQASARFVGGKYKTPIDVDWNSVHARMLSHELCDGLTP